MDVVDSRLVMRRPRQVVAEREEAHAPVVVREPPQKRQQTRLILGADGAYVGYGAVAQGNVGLQRNGVHSRYHPDSLCSTATLPHLDDAQPLAERPGPVRPERSAL